MGAITGTLAQTTEFAGNARVVILTATPAANSDVITLTKATHGISEILFVTAVLEGGADAALSAGIQVSFSGLAITIDTLAGAAGTAATNWTSATIRLMVIGNSEVAAT